MSFPTFNGYGGKVRTTRSCLYNSSTLLTVFGVNGIRGLGKSTSSSSFVHSHNRDFPRLVQYAGRRFPIEDDRRIGSGESTFAR